MGKGLEKGSPIEPILRLTKDNYDALIDRHGQYVRWMTGERCACVLETGRPDPNCAICGGDGWKYGYQYEKTVRNAHAAVVGTKILELGTKNILEILEIRNSYGEKITANGVFGEYVTTETAFDKNGDYYVDYRESLVITEECLCEVVGENLLHVVSANSVYPGGWTKIEPEIVDVIEVVNDTKGETYTVGSFYRQTVEVEFPQAAPEAGDDIRAAVEIALPQQFLLLNQGQNKIEQQFLDDIGGTAVLSFPYEYNVSEGDVVMLLVGDAVGKTVITCSGEETDRLPEWNVVDIIKIEGADGTTYREGTDFSLTDYNKVKWIGDIVDIPDEGDHLAVTYRYSPTYRVLQEMPNIRSAENQQLPRRVALKLLNMRGAEVEGL